MSDASREMTAARESESVVAQTVVIFTSVRTTIVLLILLAVASIFGTVIPQGSSQWTGAVSPFTARLAVILDLHNIYNSWWFLLLLGLLATNLVACLIKRMPLIVSEWSGERRKASFMATFTDKRSQSALKEIVTSEMRPIMGGARRETGEGDTLRLSWVRHRFYVLGFPFIHCGIIVILIGGLIGSQYGFRGHIVIKEGEVGENFVLQDTREVRRLPFQIAVDKFTLETYEKAGRGKRPKEYRSDVRLLEDGKVAVAAPIRVNHPVTYRSLSLYQADYQVVGVKSVGLKLIGSGGTNQDFKLAPGEQVKLPETQFKVKLLSLDPGATRKGAGVELQVEAEGGQPQRVGVFAKNPPPKLDKWEIKFAGYELRYSTGLQIGYDPGTPVVWTGSILLCCGFFLTLFTNHRRLWIELTQRGDETRVRVYGRSRRLRREFRESVETAIGKALGRSEPHTDSRSKDAPSSQTGNGIEVSSGSQK